MSQAVAILPALEVVVVMMVVVVDTVVMVVDGLVAVEDGSIEDGDTMEEGIIMLITVDLKHQQEDQDGDLLLVEWQLVDY